jgi:hypothetical protein
MLVKKIDKDTYIKELKDKLVGVNFEDTTKILNTLIEKLPSELYELLLCIVDDVLGNINISLDEINDKYNSLKEKFELIEDGKLAFKSYSFGTGYYSYYDEEYDYNYYDNEGIAKIIKETFDFGIYLVNNKQYKHSLKIFDLIINTNYSCKETNDLEFDCYVEEVIDCYDVDLNQVEELLEFDLKKLYSYAIYAAYFCENRYQKIYNYLSSYKNNTFEECKNLGIEKLNDLDEFYKNWIDFLININDELAEKLIKEAMLYINVDEYIICKKSFKTHPNLYKEYLLKLFENSNYNKIIETYEEAINKIIDAEIKKDISYIVIDAINSCKSGLDKSKYYYCIFNNVKNIPNFLVILNNNLYNEEIKKYVDELSYKNDEISCLDDKSYYEFFLGKFEAVYINIFNDENNMQDNMVYLIMLYLCDCEVMTKTKENILRILTGNFDEYHYRNINIDLNNKYSSLLEKFNEWKQKTKMDEDLKELFIDKLQFIINRKVSYILENKYRDRYSQAAIFVVMFDEVLSNNNFQKKDNYINKIEKQYMRFNSFRKELNKYK